MVGPISSSRISRRTCLRAVGGALGGAAWSHISRSRSWGDEGAAAPKRDPQVIERAAALTRECIVIDAYNCGAYAKHRHEPAGWFSQRGAAQVDLIKAI